MTRENIASIGMWLVTFGVFYLPRCIRLGLFGTANSGANLIPFLGCCLILYGKRNIKLLYGLILVVLFAITVITEYNVGLAKSSMLIILLVNLMFPLVLFGMDDLSFSCEWIGKYIKLMNIAILLTFCTGLLNAISGGGSITSDRYVLG